MSDCIYENLERVFMKERSLVILERAKYCSERELTRINGCRVLTYTHSSIVVVMNSSLDYINAPN